MYFERGTLPLDVLSSSLVYHGLYLVEYPGIYETDYFTSLFGGCYISKKKENVQMYIA